MIIMRHYLKIEMISRNEKRRIVMVTGKELERG